jgi:chromosome segregation and condensation protein ScpB
MPSIADIIGAIIARSGGKNDLAASVNALVEERRKSRESGQVDIRINQQKLEMQVSHNYDDNVKRLIEVKRQLKMETNPGIIKVLKKY